MTHSPQTSTLSKNQLYYLIQYRIMDQQIYLIHKTLDASKGIPLPIIYIYENNGESSLILLIFVFFLLFVVWLLVWLEPQPTFVRFNIIIYENVTMHVVDM